jgi:hypothetical protein
MMKIMSGAELVSAKVDVGGRLTLPRSGGDSVLSSRRDRVFVCEFQRHTQHLPATD